MTNKAGDIIVQSTGVTVWKPLYLRLVVDSGIKVNSDSNWQFLSSLYAVKYTYIVCIHLLITVYGDCQTRS